MNDNTRAVIVGGARTPVGRFMGSLATLSGADLGAHAIGGALDRALINPEQVDYVVMGQVLTAGAGQNPTRQAALAAGIPQAVPALTIYNVCLSGIAAIALAAQHIRTGECDIVVAGGQESMSQAPHLLTKSRNGFRYGDVTVQDHLAHDGLHDAATNQSMGALTENRNTEQEHITRHEQDAFAAQSHQRAARAWKNGFFDDEVCPIPVPKSRGEHDDVHTDEGVRGDTTAESLAALRPAFAAQGTITAASASQLSDGAAALVVMSKARAETLGSW
jgi:acetyl-CoA C-acetyltransferase